jgi:hypothetical protein
MHFVLSHTDPGAQKCRYLVMLLLQPARFFIPQGSFSHLLSPSPPAASCHVMVQYQAEVTRGLGRILEEEDNLIAAHRWQIEETMAIVRQEMTLLGQVAPLCPSS